MYESSSGADEHVHHPDVTVITDDVRSHMDPRFILAYRNGSFDGVYGAFLPDERAKHAKTVEDVPDVEGGTVFVTAVDVSARGTAMLLSHEYLHHVLFEVVGEQAAIELDNVVEHEKTIWGETFEYGTSRR